jgi:hypothetical protein
MTPLLCAVLMLAGGVDDTGEAARALRQLEAWHAGKEYIGLSEADVLCRLGPPSARRPGAWEYREPLGPGAHSFVLVRVVRFRDGRVVAAALEERPVGCILIEPRGR